MLQFLEQDISTGVLGLGALRSAVAILVMEASP